MALETIIFVQGLSRTPFTIFPRYPTPVFPPKKIANQNISRKSKIWKAKSPGSLTSAQEHHRVAVNRFTQKIQMVMILPKIMLSGDGQRLQRSHLRLKGGWKIFHTEIIDVCDLCYWNRMEQLKHTTIQMRKETKKVEQETLLVQ